MYAELKVQTGMRIQSVLIAISAVEKKELSIRKAATAYGVPKGALNCRVNGRLKKLSFVVNFRQRNAWRGLGDMFTMQTMVSRRMLYCYRRQCDLCVCVCVCVCV